MMRSKHVRNSVLLILAFCSFAQADTPEPVIDMHFHAMAADGQGPPPMAMCTPMTMPVWDQRAPYPETFMRGMKEPDCDDPVWSPDSDAEVMNQSIEIMERRNIIGVLSGTPERVGEWRAASPDRLLPGIAARFLRFTEEEIANHHRM